MVRYRDRLIRFSREQRGGTALEFALVGPVLLLLVLAIIENGLMLFVQAALDNATAAAARQVQIGAITTSTAFRTSVCGTLSSLLDCTKLQIYAASGTSSFPSALVPSASGTFSSSGFSLGSGSSYVLVEAAYDRSYIAPLLIRLDAAGWVLFSVKAFQNEPFS